MSELGKREIDFWITPDELRFHGENPMGADGRVHVKGELLIALADKLEGLQTLIAELVEDADRNFVGEWMMDDQIHLIDPKCPYCGADAIFDQEKTEFVVTHSEDCQVLKHRTLMKKVKDLGI